MLSTNEWTDGDSFPARLPDGRLETFRLYFVEAESPTRNSLRKCQNPLIRQDGHFLISDFGREFPVWLAQFGASVQPGITVKECLEYTEQHLD